MGRPYSDINRATELQFGLTNYIEYLTDPNRRQTKRLKGGTTGAARSLVACSVRPFSDAVPDFALTRISTAADTALTASLSSRYWKSGANFTSAVKVSNFKPAKVTVKGMTNLPANVPYKQSKKTKLYYVGYNWNLSVGAPFGSTSAAEEERQGMIAVKAAVVTNLGGTFAKLLVNFSSETYKP